MIQNEEQYKITKEWMRKFQESINTLMRNPSLEKTFIASQISMMEELRGEVAKYEWKKVAFIVDHAIQFVQSFHSMDKAPTAANLITDLREIAELAGRRSK